jgi:hypothetical protein
MPTPVIPHCPLCANLLQGECACLVPLQRQAGLRKDVGAPQVLLLVRFVFCDVVRGFVPAQAEIAEGHEVSGVWAARFDGEQSPGEP